MAKKGSFGTISQVSRDSQYGKSLPVQVAWLALVVVWGGSAVGRLAEDIKKPTQSKGPAQVFLNEACGF